ncbi:MAG: CDP-alcohol phosphatidyltransferase family protein [Firmicutes bacterium]|nr:CDP-alcohol phosphatidyltransferase family protein [Bacillota bacterium]
MFKFIGVYDYTVILTYTSLVSAVIGIIQATHGRFTAAILCLFLSGVCDAFDGKVARTKKDRTDDEKAFGIQLDSLCDVVSFGVFPAVLCYCMGTSGVLGVVLACAYCICAVMRLAFFNVIEGKRQQTEGGANKVYRGLPVTSIALIFPIVYIFGKFLNDRMYTGVLCVMLAVVAFLFIFDFEFKKPQIDNILHNEK